MSKWQSKGARDLQDLQNVDEGTQRAHLPQAAEVEVSEVRTR
jgi:hypothetical protein